MRGKFILLGILVAIIVGIVLLTTSLKRLDTKETKTIL